jgi:hypothetical protein
MLKGAQQGLSLELSFVLTAASSYLYRNPEPVPETGAGGAAEGAQMSLSELEALVAPLAPYPDALVAQILAAATFPDQVAIADYWLHQNQNLTDHRSCMSLTNVGFQREGT